MKLAVELGETGRAGYGSIHRTGCRDLSDPEPIGEASTMAEIQTLLEKAIGWEDTVAADYIAPCVKLPKGDA